MGRILQTARDVGRKITRRATPVKRDGATTQELQGARVMGRKFAKSCLDQFHPRVMDTEFQFQQLRDLRNHVRGTRGGGQFNSEIERPLYEAFLAGILDYAQQKGYVRSHTLSARD